MLGDRRAPRDVVHRPRALAATLGRRRVVGDERPARVATQLPAPVAQRVGAEQLLEHRCAVLGGRTVGAHALKATQGELVRDLGVLGDHRLVARAHDQLVPEALGVGEPQPTVLALRRHALVAQPSLPEAQRVVGGDAPDDPVDHPGAGAAGDGARVLEERQLRAGPPALVAVEQVVDGRVVLVDGLGHQPQAENAGVEVHVARGVAGDRRDVVDSLEAHHRGT